MRYRQLLPAFLLSLSLILAACDRGTPLPAATASPLAGPSPTSTEPSARATRGLTPTPPPPTPTLEPTLAPDPGLAGANLGIPEKLDGFRSTLTVSMLGQDADGADASSTFSVATEWVRDPLTEHITLTGEVPGAQELTAPGEPAPTEMYRAGDMLYVQLSGGWVAGPLASSGQDLGTAGFGAAQALLEAVRSARYEGVEVVNGVRTRHYTFTEQSLDATRLAASASVEHADGHAYVAVDGLFLVRVKLNLQGAGLSIPFGEHLLPIAQGTLSLELDVRDINLPVVVALPEEAQAAGEPPGDIPIPAGAKELQVDVGLGLITFRSASPAEEVANYYRAELPRQGWTEVSFERYGDLFTVAYSRQARTAELMIAPDQASGTTIVVLTVTTQ